MFTGRYSSERGLKPQGQGGCLNRRLKPTEKEELPRTVLTATKPTEKEELPRTVLTATKPTEKVELPRVVLTATKPTEKEELPRTVLTATKPTEKEELPQVVLTATESSLEYFLPLPSASADGYESPPLFFRDFSPIKSQRGLKPPYGA